MKVTADGVLWWWERPEQPLIARKQRLAELRTKAEAGAPTVSVPLEQRYFGFAGPVDNPLGSSRFERFDYPKTGSW